VDEPIEEVVAPDSLGGERDDVGIVYGRWALHGKEGGVVLPDTARLPVDALVRLVRQERIGELPEVLAPAAVWRPPG
jgi:hypothetical protein